MKSDLGQIDIAAGQAAIAVGDLALEYSNSKKLAKLQAGFQRILDSDATKIDYVNDIIQRIQIAATTLAHTGQLQPGTPLFNKYLSLIVKDDMQYNGNCYVSLYQPSPAVNTPKTTWISINRDGYVQPYGVAPPDVGIKWASGCKSGEDQAKVEYIRALRGREITGGLWTGLRGRIQQLTRSDIATVDLLMRMGLGILIISGLVLILKVQGTLIEEQRSVRYVKRAKPQSKMPKPKSRHL